MHVVLLWVIYKNRKCSQITWIDKQRMLSEANKLKKAHPHHSQTLAFTVQASIFSTDTDREDMMDPEQVIERLCKCTDTNSASYKVSRSESGGILHLSFRDKMLKEWREPAGTNFKHAIYCNHQDTRLYIRFSSTWNWQTSQLYNYNIIICPQRSTAHCIMIRVYYMR